MAVPDLELIMLDFDGTIVDSSRHARTSFIATAKHFGYAVSEEQYDSSTLWGSRNDDEVQTALTEFGIRIPWQVFFEMYERINAEALHESVTSGRLPLLKGVKEFMGAAREKGILLPIVTDNSIAAVQYVLDTHRLKFDGVWSPKTGNFDYKPSPSMLLSVVETYRIPKSVCAMLGDTKLDALAGKNAGVTAIHVGPSIIELADYNFSDLLEAKAYLLG